MSFIPVSGTQVPDSIQGLGDTFSGFEQIESVLYQADTVISVILPFHQHD